MVRIKNITLPVCGLMYVYIAIWRFFLNSKQNKYFICSGNITRLLDTCTFFIKWNIIVGKTAMFLLLHNNQVSEVIDNNNGIKMCSKIITLLLFCLKNPYQT